MSNIRNLLQKAIDTNQYREQAQSLLNLINEALEKNQKVVLLFQPGAGAPVTDFLQEWIQCGLAGCTPELKALSELAKENPGVTAIVISSVTSEEVKASLITEKRFSCKAHENIKFFDDGLSRIAEKLLNKFVQKVEYEGSSYQHHSLKSQRLAYTPEAWVLDADTNVIKEIKRHPDSATREPQDYLSEVIQNLPAEEAKTHKKRRIST